MSRRDRHDIVMEILNKAMPGRRKTDIMREVGLSYTQTKQYFHTLQSMGMIEIGKDHTLKTTSKGLRFMEKCSECFLCDWHTKEEAKS